MFNLWPIEDEMKLFQYIKDNQRNTGKICWNQFLEIFPDKTINQGQAKYFRMRQETDRWNFKFLSKKMQNKDNKQSIDMTQILLDDVIKLLSVLQ